MIGGFRECYQKVQNYKCKDCGHSWYYKREYGKFTRTTVIKIVYTYLRSVSFNRLKEIVYSWANSEIAKRELIGFVESISDHLPSFQKITERYKPKRSGYVGFDGLWLKYKENSFVVLIAFDVETLDIIEYQVSFKESEEGWLKLLIKCGDGLKGVKGIYIDGQLDLVTVIKNHFPNVPTQLCVFHKEIRIGQIIPLVHLKTEEDKWLKNTFEIILYSQSELQALAYFLRLGIFKTFDKKSKKKKKIYGVLKRNFHLLMTHHHYPNMHRTNNILEGFNGNIAQKLRLMRGIKKSENIERYLKLIFLDYRFRKLQNCGLKDRNKKSPLELAECENVPQYHHWIEKHYSL